MEDCSMNRKVSLVVGIALGGVAGAVLATASLADVESLLGREMAWVEPYFRLAGIAIGAVILAVALLVIGVGIGRWRRPVPMYRRRSQEVRW
jgi:hypothetical protein